MRLVRSACVVVASAGLLPLARVEAGDAEDAAKAAFAAAAKVRAALPEPLEDKGLAFEWKGDLVLVGEAAGTVSLSVDVGEHRGKAIWLVTEDVRQEWGGSVVETSWSLYLARDLSLIRGEATRDEGERRVHLSFLRDPEAPGSFRVEREIERRAPASGDAPAAEPASVVKVTAAEGATFGHGATLLFLKYAPKDKARYAIPVAPLTTAWPWVEEHAPVVDPAVRLEVRGPGKWKGKSGERETFVAAFDHVGEVAEVHLAPKDRAPIAVEFARPPGKRWVPKGEAGPRAEYGDDKPATTWKAAFLKFGHGYHMAERAWLEASCHWPSVLAYDRADGSWKEEWGGVDAVKEAYVKEWLERSKHRGRAEADWLLTLTLQTGTEQKLPDGTVVLKTHPEFGGNVFRFRPVDGVWYIVGIDQ